MDLTSQREVEKPNDHESKLGIDESKKESPSLGYARKVRPNRPIYYNYAPIKKTHSPIKLQQTNIWKFYFRNPICPDRDLSSNFRKTEMNRVI